MQSKTQRGLAGGSATFVRSPALATSLCYLVTEELLDFLLRNPASLCVVVDRSQQLAQCAGRCWGSDRTFDQPAHVRIPINPYLASSFVELAKEFVADARNFNGPLHMLSTFAVQ